MLLYKVYKNCRENLCNLRIDKKTAQWHMSAGGPKSMVISTKFAVPFCAICWGWTAKERGGVSPTFLFILPLHFRRVSRLHRGEPKRHLPLLLEILRPSWWRILSQGVRVRVSWWLCHTFSFSFLSLFCTSFFLCTYIIAQLDWFVKGFFEIFIFVSIL